MLNEGADACCSGGGRGNSRFAFGSTPVRDDAAGFVRWSGVDGVVAIEHSGGELGILNAGAPEASLPDWSDDPTALGSHVTAYFASFGVSACQLRGTSVHAGSAGRTITLMRSFDGINDQRPRRRGREPPPHKLVIDVHIRSGGDV